MISFTPPNPESPNPHPPSSILFMRTSLLLLLSVLLWGLWGFASKAAVSRFHPYTVQWMYGVPYLLFVPLWYWLASRAAPAGETFTAVGIGWALAAGLASLGAMVLFLLALQSHPASTAVAVTSAYPLITLALSVLTGNETFNGRKLLGLLLILAGVSVLLYAES